MSNHDLTDQLPYYLVIDSNQLETLQFALEEAIELFIHLADDYRAMGSHDRAVEMEDNITYTNQLLIHVSETTNGSIYPASDQEAA